MRLFFIRHAESVDNVAGLLAGSRDASLTAHGVIQAQRLAEHLASRLDSIGPVRRIFSSPMQRTLRTAQAVADVVVREHHDSQRADAASTLNIVKVDELREKHMGALEGSKWGVKPPGDKAESFSDDMETREHMSARAVKFIDEHLVPALEPHFACDRSSNRATARGSILVVSHGIFLNIFLRSLLERFAPAELQRLSNSEAPQPKGLVSFSNTGFVEVVVSARDASATDETDPVRLPGRVLALHLQVVAINSVGHLQGLKKTRGGIGSAAFDSKQRTMDAFFGPAMKKPRRQ